MKNRICFLCYEPLPIRTRWQRFWGLNDVNLCTDPDACFQRYLVGSVGWDQAKSLVESVGTGEWLL